MTSQKNAETSVKSGDQASSKHSKIVDPVKPIKLGKITLECAKNNLFQF